MVLAPRSRLVARHQAGMRPAEVRLEGEAWFEIAHDPRHPFTVKAGDAEITDLGTVFSVRGHAGSPVEVEVLEGSVELRSAAGQRMVIEGGSAGRVEGGAITRSAVAGMARPAWIDGRLEFADATLAEVRAELRRWYGLDLRLGDSSLASRHVTASFQGEPVARVLQVIALALGASVEQRGTDYPLQGSGTAALLRERRDGRRGGKRLRSSREDHRILMSMRPSIFRRLVYRREDRQAAHKDSCPSRRARLRRPSSRRRVCRSGDSAGRLLPRASRDGARSLRSFPA